MKSHNDLKVYQESLDFVIEVYRITKNFPDFEKFGLTSQMRRASISIPSNIAEGAARSSKKEFRRFLFISLGSASELETQLEIANRLKFVTQTKPLKEQLFYIKRMLMNLIKSLEKE